MKILLEPGVWLAEGEDEDGPPRSLEEANAREFASLHEAMIALVDARRFKPFKNAQIVEEL